ncbi:uncharacterized protein [Porites lutea]|uniref:uncharacterized protein isoform X2 n=1 Tax=Porites lutea TaxID=51062 RepID=UPI003CC61742
MAANDDGLEGTDTTDSKGNLAFLPKDEDSFDFDLYGDLSVDLNQEMTYPESQKLRDENLILKKNISSLYLTAREEIKRKDAQIKTLQDREVRSRRKYVASQQ